MKEFFQELGDSLENSMQQFGTDLIDLIPRLIMAILLILVGMAVGKIAAKIVKTVLDKINIAKGIEKMNLDSLGDVSNKFSTWVSKFIYFFILLVFVISATDILGLDVVSVEIQKLIAYLPTLLSAIIIFLIGFFIAGFIRDLIKNTTKSLGISAGSLMANVVYYFLLIIIMLTTLKQANINTDLLTSNVIMMIGSVLLAAGVSYGIASRHVLTNVLATFYTKDRFVAGQVIRVDGIQGEVIEVTNISVILKTPNGKISIPTSKIVTEKVEFLD